MSGDWVVWQVAVGGGLALSSLLLAVGLLLERARRRRAEVLLGERLQFETLLSEQVATFSRISAVDVDREIQRALRRIADLLVVDWGNLTEYSDDTRTARVTHWWVADERGPQPPAIGFEEIPWVVTRLRRGELVRFSRVEDLPESDAALDRQSYRRLGIKSQVAVPLTVEGVVVGALAFSTVRTERAWRDEFVQRLHLLGDIVEDDKRAGEIIHRLRGFLKTGSLELQPLDIGDLVGQVARLVSSDVIIRHVQIRLELGAGLPPVCGDRVQLQQVILNLLMNGLDAMRESGEGERSLVLRTSSPDPAHVVVAVEDSGIGIDKADLERVFHAFFTTKPEGLGMGLAIARSIVEAHHGRLEARSNPERGATFTLTLPAAKEGT